VPVWTLEEEKNLLPISETEPRFLSLPAHNLVARNTELSRLINLCSYFSNKSILQPLLLNTLEFNVEFCIPRSVILQAYTSM
jgi:hypothetical protein